MENKIDRLDLNDEQKEILETYKDKYNDMTFEVFEITDELTRDNQDYYTFTPINTAGSNLVRTGYETITPKPYTNVTVGNDTLAPQLRLNLEPSFGQTLIDNAAQMTTNTLFTSYFKGLYIKVTDPSTLAESKGSVLYFSLEDALSKMVLYYKKDISESKTFTFNINSKCARFNKINFDRSGTDVQNVLNNLEKEPTKLTPTTVLFVEIPTNPDMKVPDITELNTVLTNYQENTGKSVILLVIKSFTIIDALSIKY